MYERDAVSNLFPPPTANQSWRKVLSMGNLLNGHEPMQREIIFSVQERISNGHYSSPTPLCTNDEQIQTHRMYISGTSNDLWVALSVTSWDWDARCMRGAIGVLISLEFRWCRSTIIVIFVGCTRSPEASTRTWLVAPWGKASIFDIRSKYWLFTSLAEVIRGVVLLCSYILWFGFV